MASERNVSVLQEHRMTLPEMAWEEITEPGAYVERESGDLYRIMKESCGASRLVQISKNPFVNELEARHRCTQHNIEPNF